MTRYFKLGPYLASDPVVCIEADFGKHGLVLEVKCDTVPCDDCTRDDEIRKMVDLLNRHWDDPASFSDEGLAVILTHLLEDAFRGRFRNTEQILVFGAVLKAWGDQICDRQEFPKTLLIP